MTLRQAIDRARRTGAFFYIPNFFIYRFSGDGLDCYQTLPKRGKRFICTFTEGENCFQLAEAISKEWRTSMTFPVNPSREAAEEQKQ